MKMSRSSGILLLPSSLPETSGIGTIGAQAYRFVDWLKSAKQSIWQILPLGPTGYGDSPYASFSTYAGNPLLIDLDMLAEKGMLNKADYENIDWESTPDSVNYGVLYQKRYPRQHSAGRYLLKSKRTSF